MQRGIAWLEEHFNIDVSQVDLNSITYNRKCEFFHGLSVALFSNNQKKIGSKFTDLGIMVDCARNGVPNIPFLKRFIAGLAMSGYSYVGLYLEDCFEVEGEPFFGYMRGRYSKNEIKEIVAFADMFGIEVVPYIQTLAHLSRLFNHWDVYFTQVRDTNDILLMDEPRTYLLIENMVKSAADGFGKGRINVGMDEAFMMTHGKYRQLHGHCEVSEVFARHVQRVCEICKKYDMQPEAWADMFLHYKEEIKAPENLTLRAWEYDSTDVAHYQNMMYDCTKIANKVTFSSAVHKYYGYTPMNEYSVPIYSAAIDGVEGKTDDFCLCLWGDDGSECSVNAVWYSIFNLANKVYHNVFEDIELDALASCITGYTIEELFALDLPNKVFDGKMRRPVNVSKYMLFSDLFMGIADKPDNVIYTKYFEKHKTILKRLSEREAPCAYVYRTLACVCEVLAVKNDLRVKIRKAYQEGNVDELARLVGEDFSYVISKLKELCKIEEEQWLKDYKPFCIEVQIYRLHGLVARVEYVKKTLERYLAGDLERIEELEETDLTPAPLEGDEHNGASFFNIFEQNITYGNLTHRVYI